MCPIANKSAVHRKLSPPNIFSADRQSHNLNTMFTRDLTPYRIYQKHDRFFLQFGFLLTTQMDVNNQSHKKNRTKMLHTIQKCIFAQHNFHRTKSFMHINSRLLLRNTKITSPYYINYSYIININPICCEETLRNFDPIKNYFLFIPHQARTHRPILVPFEYLQCVEGGSTKCMYGHNFNLFYRDWNSDKLVKWVTTTGDKSDIESPTGNAAAFFSSFLCFSSNNFLLFLFPEWSSLRRHKSYKL